MSEGAPRPVQKHEDDSVSQEFATELIDTLPSLVSLARSLAHNHTLADDLLQDTVERALRSQSRFERGSNMRNWLATILRNRFYELMRRKKIMEREDPDDIGALQMSTAPSQDAVVDLRDFGKAFEQLSPDHQAILLLVGKEEEYTDIATLLDIPVGTVKSRVKRAREALKKLQGD